MVTYTVEVPILPKDWKIRAAGGLSHPAFDTARAGRSH